LNEPDGKHISGYDPAVADQLVSEAAAIIRALGFSAAHVVLIGGLVPGLLVPVLDPGIEPHVGTADIDLCLSVALVEGDTETYERLEAVLKGLGFEEGDASFRWHRRSGLPLTVEFFCPASDDRPAGRAFRPAAADNPTGKHNLGGRLSALALQAGDVLTTDVEIITRTVSLPDGKGTVDTTFRVTGPLAFLVAKSQAIVGPTARDKPKDAYDIVWLIESWPNGPAGAASDFSARAVYQRDEVKTALDDIAIAFSSVEHVGARSYARFVATSMDEEPQLERRAVGAIAEFVGSLPPAREA
jgi:hypothetical protein